MTPRQGRGLAVGVATFAWYALPDVVRSPAARIAVKAGLIINVCVLHALTREEREPTNGPDTVDAVLHAANQSPGRALAVGMASVSVGVAITVLGEKLIFGLGERRRARGATAAHTVPALLMGGLAAAGYLLDPVASR